MVPSGKGKMRATPRLDETQEETDREREENILPSQLQPIGPSNNSLLAIFAPERIPGYNRLASALKITKQNEKGKGRADTGKDTSQENIISNQQPVQQATTSSLVQHSPHNLSPEGSLVSSQFFEGSSNVVLKDPIITSARDILNNMTVIHAYSHHPLVVPHTEYHSSQQHLSPPSSSSQMLSNNAASSPIPDIRDVSQLPPEHITEQGPSTSTIIHSLDNSSKIYKHHLGLKQRGSPLWIPGPNRSLPISYQRRGVSIGDVGIITPSGAFSFLFNICLPADDPINHRVPNGFAPIYPPIEPTDLNEYPGFDPESYLASKSIVKMLTDSQFRGLSFKTLAAEGAILTLPDGAIPHDLANIRRFRAYAAAHIEKWYRYVNGDRGLEVENGEILLVTGCDKATSWGMAAVSNIIQDETHYLDYLAVGDSNTALAPIPLYKWHYTGAAEARVGPSLQDIADLKLNDDSDAAVQGKYWNQCLFVRTLNPMLSDDVFAMISRELDLALTLEIQQFQRSGDPSNARSSHSNAATQTNDSGQQSGPYLAAQTESTSESLGLATEILSDVVLREPRMTMSRFPNIPKSHPADVLNKLLLQKCPNSRVVITQDKDWCSVIKEVDEIMPSPSEIAERVLATHHIREEDGLVFLEPKNMTNLPLATYSPVTSSHERQSFKDMNTKDIRIDVMGPSKTGKNSVDRVNMPILLNDLGVFFERRFRQTGNLTDIGIAITSYQNAIRLTPKGHANLPTLLKDLGTSFQRRFEYTGDLEDIESATSTLQRAIELTPEGHVSMPTLFNDLGIFFQSRFEKTGKLEDVANAISAHQNAIQLTPLGHATFPTLFRNLGSSFQRRFEHTGDLADIENAISIYQRVIQLIPEGHADMPFVLNELGSSFQMRFGQTDNFADIESAISTHQRAVLCTPEEHTNLPTLLNDLGISFRMRFGRTGDLADIESAISIHERAVQLTPEGHASMPALLNNLGSSFHTRFGHTGDLADIENAISTHQRAVQLTEEGTASMPALLNSLGLSFYTRFRRTGNLVDVENAISTHQRAIKLTPEGHASMPTLLSNLGSSFQRRFKYTGDPADIASAISTHQRAVQLTPEGHASMPALLNDLGSSFQLRFGQTDDLSDIANAISTHQRAIQLTPEGHVNMPALLNDLGVSFQKRFGRTSNLADLANAISTHTRAIGLTPHEHSIMPTILNDLGVSFRMRFGRIGDLTDIENAISIQQRAIDLTPEGHACMPTLLNDLGSSFQMRFEHIGNLADIENAISIRQKAVQLAPEGHADISFLLNGLGISFRTRFTSTHNISDVHDAISTFRLSATQINGDPSTRLEAARNWAQLSRIHDTSQLLDAFSVAIQLLPQVAGLEQTINKRHQTLSDVSDITAAATAAAINGGEFETALAWLEQGRCLVWKQINDLRISTDDLRAYNPSLADRFLHIAHALEMSGSRQEQHTTFSEGNMIEMVSLQEEVHIHVHLAKEWNQLLLEIRSIPQFKDFLRPPQVSNLLSRLPPDGPIVIFNLHEDRCDALALIFGLDCPVHIPLETFSLKKAIQLRDEMHQYLRHQHTAYRGVSRLQDHVEVDIYKVFRELWEHVAKPVLDALAYSPHHSNPPHIWWCPTGPLAFLPIHAAGIYSQDRVSAGPCISDYVVSSYTLTISTLLDKIKEASIVDMKPTSLLIISQPSTPGWGPIPGAEKETYTLRDMIRPPLKSLLLEDASATVNRVQEEIRTHSWVHFACHAVQDKAEPLKSGVQLYDGRLELSEIMKQTLPNADFAFLSACQTGTGDERLADEVVHFTAGMLNAGYRSVVAAMWPIKDQYAPIVVKDFYAFIFAEISEDQWLNSTNAARALHYAMQKLRKELGDTEEALLTWVPYIHYGT